MESNNDHDDDAAAALAAHFVDAEAAVNHDDASETETVHDADDDAEQATNDTRLILKALMILQDRLDFPFRTRNKIVELAQQFVDGVGDDISDMITDNHTEEEGYQGLDADRDTEQEVEKALRCFPESLTRRGGQFNDLPFQCLLVMYDTNGYRLHNVKAISFVHLFVRLAIEYHSFEEEERGGLLTEDDIGENKLMQLSYGDDHQQNGDAACLAVLTRLRQSGFSKKEDIQQHQLIRL